MLLNINRFIEKWMFILTPISLVIGIILKDFGEPYLFLIPWLFAFMTFTSSLSLKLQDLSNAKVFGKFILLALFVLHIVTPLIAFVFANLFYDDQLLTIGFLLSVIIPTGVTSFIWVTICKGNGALCLAIILIDTLLAPILLPVTLQLLFSKTIEVNTLKIIGDLLWMVVAPSLIGLILNEVTKGKIKEKWGNRLSPFSKLSIFLIVLLNGSIISPYFQTINGELFKIIVSVFFIAFSGYVVALIIARYLYKEKQLIHTFVFICGMRNISVGAVIASTYFPARVVMPVVLGMLFQQILASTFSKYLMTSTWRVEERGEYIAN